MSIDTQVNIKNDIVLYTVKEIQEIFKCGKRNAYEIVHTRGFPKIIMGKKILVEKNALEKWLKMNEGKQVSIG